MDIIVNETPVRTSKNYGINSVKLNDIKIPEKLKEFNNVKIDSNKSKISNKIENQKLAYGNGEILENNVYNNSNNILKIETEKEDIKIVYEFDDNNLNLINNIEIIGNKNCNIVIEYKSNTDKTCFHNSIIKAIAKENVKLNISIVNLLNDNSLNFEAIENTLENNSIINYTIIDLGAKTSITNYYSNVLGNNANNDLKSIYLGQKDELKDINYIVDLYGEKSNVDIDVQGALDDNAIKNFKGTIDFKNGCKKAEGNENEFCLLLSSKAKSKALPMLLCTEEDVEGNHSTASGSVDNSELFYIMSRGISYKEAVKLIVKSRFNKIIERISDEYVKNEISDEIDRRLG